MLFGASNTTSSAGPLPISLSVLGLSGCWLRVSDDVAVPVMGDTGGSATLTFTVPMMPALIGLPFYQQAVVHGDRAAGVVMSDAAAAVVGP